MTWLVTSLAVNPLVPLQTMVFNGFHKCFGSLQQALTGLCAALKRDPDNEIPRTPPPSATPLDFPCCEPKPIEASDRTPIDLAKVFSGIHKGPTTEHLNALNLNLKSDIPLEELVPADHLPHTSWLQTPNPNTDSNTQPILVNVGSLPAQEIFHARAKELQISNEDGYKTIHRIPLAKNKGPIRLLFFRKFWDELDCLADYWDTSQDKYTKSLSKSRKRSGDVAMDVDQLRGTAQQISKMSEQGEPGNVSMGHSSSGGGTSTAPLNESPDVSTPNDTPMPDVASSEASDATSSPNPTESALYTGYRTSTGSSMPLQHLEKVLFAFLDPLALPFRLRLVEPRSQPRLQLGPLLLPLPHMASVHRVPLDQSLARQGWREGPLMGAVAAEYAVWRDNGERPGEGARERLQLLKEVGCVLLLAQRRAMEGKAEVVPGKGKWWTEVPKWGGGSGVALYKDPESEKPATAAGGGKSKLSLIEAQRRRVKRAARRGTEGRTKANVLVPPSSLWEKNVKYARIGMQREGAGDTVDDVSPPGSEWYWDQVVLILTFGLQIYLVSSVNHHLSIIHARVHTRYIDHLTKGGDLAEQHEEWWKLEMRRSQWFDLLDPGDRFEAMRGVWAVISWLMREKEE